MPVRAIRCCQAYSGDQGHHDKASHPAARHDRFDGDAARDLCIACADRAARRGASQGRGWSSRRQEGGTEGCPASGCCANPSGSPSAATPGSCAATASGSAAATACCGSASASHATPAASGGGASSASDATSAAPGCRAEAADSAAASPGGCTFASDAAAASSTGSRACGAEATGRTDYATSSPAAAFNSEVDAITRAATAAGRRQTAAGACHHAGSDSTADSCPSAWRKHDDGATAASRRAGNASECGRPDNCTDHAARTTRRAASCRAKRWRSPGRSGRDATGRRSHRSWRRSPHGTDRRTGRAEFSATSRPGAKRPADGRAGLPSGPASHRTVASGPAAGRRRHQSHSRGCATSRTATPRRLPRPAPREPAGRPYHHHRARPDHHSRSRRPAICPSQRSGSLPLWRA